MGDMSAVPLRRVILILLPVLLLAVAGYWWLSRPDYVVFAQGLRPADAAAVVAELDKQGTPYRLEGGGATILVPADRADETRVALAGSDVAARGLVGFELFNESDMGLTNFAQKINYQRALQGELTRTILMMDGVENARIHLALPEKALFRGDRAEASAAVAIEMKPGAVLDPSRVAGIQRLVAAAAIDLPPSRVVVLDGAGRQIGGGEPTFPPAVQVPMPVPPAPVAAIGQEPTPLPVRQDGGWWIGAAVALAGLGIVALWRRRARPALDAAGHDAFALRLRQTLEAADARA